MFERLIDSIRAAFSNFVPQNTILPCAVQATSTAIGLAGSGIAAYLGGLTPSSAISAAVALAAGVSLLAVKLSNGWRAQRPPDPPVPTQEEIEENFKAVARFRKDNKIKQYKQMYADTGTVAFVNLSAGRYFGVNSKLDEHLALSLEYRRTLFLALQQEGKILSLANLGQAQFLSHAEVGALVKAFEDQNALPEKIIMYSDRPTCKIARSIFQNCLTSLESRRFTSTT